MKKIGIVVPFCLLMLTLLTGCPRQKYGTSLIPESLKGYSVFQAGSYWIFRNERTALTDSVFIGVSPRFTLQQSGDGPYMEYCKITYDSSLFSGGGLDWDEYWLTFTHHYGATCLKAASFQPGYVFSISNGTFRNLDNFDSLEVNGKMFYHVMNTQYETVSFDRDTSVYTFYVAQSVGLIKFNFRLNSADTTWSVIRYRAIR